MDDVLKKINLHNKIPGEKLEFEDLNFSKVENVRIEMKKIGRPFGSDVIVTTGDTSTDSLNETRIKNVIPQSIAQKIPIVGAILNTGMVMTMDPAELAEILAPYGEGAAMVETILGKINIIWDPEIARQLVLLENRMFDVSDENGNIVAADQLYLTRHGGMTDMSHTIYHRALIALDSGKMHDELRQILSPYFSKDVLLKRKVEFEKVAQQLISKLQDESVDGIIDINILKESVLNLLLQIVLGVPEEDCKKFYAVPEILVKLQKHAFNFFLMPIREHLPNGEYVALREELKKYMDLYLEEYKDTAFVKNLSKIDNDDVKRGVVAEIFAAGQDTTSNFMLILLHFLSQSEDLGESIQDLISDIRLGNMEPNAIYDDNGVLARTMKEVGRLLPVTHIIPFEMPNELSLQKEDKSYVTIPAGRTFILPAVMGHHPSYVSDEMLMNYIPEGTNPAEVPGILSQLREEYAVNKINPDRWVDSEGNAVDIGQLSHFTEGARTCLGIHFANMYIQTAVAEILKTGNVQIETAGVRSTATGTTSLDGERIEWIPHSES